MKKITLILCLIVSLLCFASCGKQDNDQPQSSEAPQSSEQTAEPPADSENPQDESGSANTEAGTEPAQSGEAGTETAAPGENKLEPAAYYGGPVKSIEGDKLVITSDITDQDIEFNLSEKAKKDIEHHGVTEGMVVVVDYEPNEDGTKTATNVSVQINDGKRDN